MRSERQSDCTILEPSVAKGGAYIYALAGAVNRLSGTYLYIGQTVGRLGALGRLSQHLSDDWSNTFIQRLSALLRLADVHIQWAELFASRLPDHRSYLTRNPDHREAVEYLVQMGALNRISTSALRACVVSRVTPNANVYLRHVDQDARRVEAELGEWLEHITSTRAEAG